MSLQVSTARQLEVIETSGKFYNDFLKKKQLTETGNRAEKVSGTQSTGNVT